jgi:hypothetical protein
MYFQRSKSIVYRRAYGFPSAGVSAGGVVSASVSAGPVVSFVVSAGGSVVESVFAQPLMTIAMTTSIKAKILFIF